MSVGVDKIKTNKQLRNLAKRMSGRYGVKSKKRDILGYEITDEEGNKKKVGSSYNLKNINSNNVTPIYAKSRGSNVSRKGKNKLGGAAASIPIYKAKPPVEDIEEQSVENVHRKFDSKGNTKSSDVFTSKNEEEFKENQKSAAAQINEKANFTNKPLKEGDVGYKEFETNKKVGDVVKKMEKRKYDKGERTRQQVAANKKAQAGVVGEKVGKRSSYRRILKTLKDENKFRKKVKKDFG